MRGTFSPLRRTAVNLSRSSDTGTCSVRSSTRRRVRSRGLRCSAISSPCIMLKIRVIPVLLWNGQGLVKGKRFDSSRMVGSAMQAVKVFNMREGDELGLLDIQATAHG